MGRGRWHLVAKREYLEHVRTKAFWIGIFAFPVLLTLGMTVPQLLKDRVDVREYAVIDASGWLLEAVEKRAERPDWLALLEKLRDDPPERLGSEEFLAPELQDWVSRIYRNKGSIKAGIISDRMLERTAQALEQLAAPGGLEMLAKAGFPQALVEMTRKWLDLLHDYWRSLPPAEAAALAADRDKDRYRRREVPGADAEKLKRLVDEGELFAFFEINADPVESAEGCRYYARNVADQRLRNWFQRHATALVRQRRIARSGIDTDQAEWLGSRLVFQQLKVGAGGKAKEASIQDRLLQVAPAAFSYLLWISIMIMAQVLLTSTIEEKSNRVIEVLLSSVTAMELMSGKILGTVATGLTMVLSWAFFFVLLTSLLPLAVDLGVLDLGAILTNPLYCFSFLGYYLMGYLFFAAILVGLGSACTSLKEAQNLMQPVMILFIMPFFAIIAVTMDPQGALARFLSFIPLFTPFVMMNRAAGPPEAWEYIATTALMLVCLVIAFWGAAKIFRVGILMTGKQPRLGEILRWLRAPVGQVPERPEEPRPAGGKESP